MTNTKFVVGIAYNNVVIKNRAGKEVIAIIFSEDGSSKTYKCPVTTCEFENGTNEGIQIETHKIFSHEITTVDLIDSFWNTITKAEKLGLDDVSKPMTDTVNAYTHAYKYAQSMREWGHQ